MSTLIDIAIQQVLFLATASDSDVHPDVAVSQLEVLAAGFAELPAEELAALRERVREQLAEAPEPQRRALIELDSMLD